jgi:integrase
MKSSDDRNFAIPQDLTSSTEYSVPDGLDIRFAAFLGFAHGYLNHSRATLRWYTDAYRQFRQFVLDGGFMTLEGCAVTEHVERWIVATRGRGVSPFTIRSYYQALRAFFTYLESHDGYPNPFRVLRLPTVPDAAPKARTMEECTRILDAAENADWGSPYLRARAVAMLGMALYAGLRRGEILRLSFSEVNFEDASIHIIRGKGIGGGKDRMTYAAPELLAILRRYLKERRCAQLHSTAFFASSRGGNGTSAATLKRMVDRVRRTSGIPFTLHSLRHSFVTMLVRANTPINVVRDLAGHRDIKTTERYLRTFDADKRAYMERLTFRQLVTITPFPGSRTF